MNELPDHSDQDPRRLPDDGLGQGPETSDVPIFRCRSHLATVPTSRRRTASPHDRPLAADQHVGERHPA